jgi:hypothetical protein
MLQKDENAVTPRMVDQIISPAKMDRTENIIPDMATYHINSLTQSHIRLDQNFDDLVKYD